MITAEMLIRLLQMWPPYKETLVPATYISSVGWSIVGKLDKALVDERYVCSSRGAEPHGVMLILAPKGKRIVAAILGVASALDPILEGGA